MARAFAADAETIRCDLDALGLEYPIEENRKGREVFYRFADGFPFDFPQIEIEELAVLPLAQEAIKGIGITAGDSFYAASADALLNKIRKSLPRSTISLTPRPAASREFSLDSNPKKARLIEF